MGGQAFAQGKAVKAAPAPAAATGGYATLVAAAQDCLKTGAVCEEHCVATLSKGDTSMAECLGTVRAMLASCEALAALGIMGSGHTKAFAAVCAKVCRDCEAACKKHENHHAECKACMESCAKCAAACEKA